MRKGHAFFWGVVFGVGGTWAFHKFVRPLPGKNG